MTAKGATGTPAALLARRVRARNLREYVAAAIVIPVFAALAATSRGTLLRLGHGLIVLAAVVAAVFLHRRGGNTPPPVPDAPTREHLGHYRAELARQRDLLASAGRWYLLPFLPGMGLLLAGTADHALTLGARTFDVALRIAIPLSGIVLAVAVILAANKRATRALAREIAALGKE